jgi:hypothetical protein
MRARISTYIEMNIYIYEYKTHTYIYSSICLYEYTPLEGTGRSTLNKSYPNLDTVALPKRGTTDRDMFRYHFYEYYKYRHIYTHM